MKQGGKGLESQLGAPCPCRTGLDTEVPAWSCIVAGQRCFGRECFGTLGAMRGFGVKVSKMQLISGQAQMGFRSGGLMDSVELRWCWDCEWEKQVWQWMHCPWPRQQALASHGANPVQHFLNQCLLRCLTEITGQESRGLGTHPPAPPPSLSRDFRLFASGVSLALFGKSLIDAHPELLTLIWDIPGAGLPTEAIRGL